MTCPLLACRKASLAEGLAGQIGVDVCPARSHNACGQPDWSVKAADVCQCNVADAEAMASDFARQWSDLLISSAALDYLLPGAGLED